VASEAVKWLLEGVPKPPIVVNLGAFSGIGAPALIVAPNTTSAPILICEAGKLYCWLLKEKVAVIVGVLYAVETLLVGLLAFYRNVVTILATEGPEVDVAEAEVSSSVDCASSDSPITAIGKSSKALLSVYTVFIKGISIIVQATIIDSCYSRVCKKTFKT
jgi:hypothetical protein